MDKTPGGLGYALGESQLLKDPVLLISPGDCFDPRVFNVPSIQILKQYQKASSTRVDVAWPPKGASLPPYCYGDSTKAHKTYSRALPKAETPKTGTTIKSRESLQGPTPRTPRNTRKPSHPRTGPRGSCTCHPTSIPESPRCSLPLPACKQKRSRPWKQDDANKRHD